MRLTPARFRALSDLASGPLCETGRVIAGIRVGVLQALVEAGLAKYRPSGSPPTWAITQDGRDILARIHY